MNEICYKVIVGTLYTFCSNGLELDALVKNLIERGLKSEEIKITIVEKRSF